MGFFDWFKRKAPPAPAQAPPPKGPPPIPAELADLERRPAWQPLTEPGEGAASGSRVGGRPFLLDGEEWPTCGACQSPLHLVVQLRSEDLPPEVVEQTGPGLFQMLYCLSICESDHDGWAPYSAVHCARRLPLDASGGVREGGRAVASRAIVGWTPQTDLPNWEEMATPLPDELEDACFASERPLTGDKLGGWPAWVQGVEYPSCNECGGTMDLLFQVDSNHNLDYMWGDVGCAHLSQCREHPEQLAFGWACC